MASTITRMARFVVLLLASFALASCGGTSGLAKIDSAPSGAYRVESGDQLLITVQNLDTAKGEYVIDDSGSISLPMIKDVMVRGKTFREIEDAIENTYRTAGILTNPLVTVQPGVLRPFYVMGEVNKPGEYAYRQGMTVLAALSAAGGYTYRAQTGSVAITRTTNGQNVEAKATEDTPIQPGDRIRVYERWF
ncbi:MAG: polysaccharide biosynthesis/export family protein [Novosphingobium sp.]